MTLLSLLGEPGLRADPSEGISVAPLDEAGRTPYPFGASTDVTVAS